MSDIFFSGNLTADPELRTIQSGDSVANFTIANTKRKYNRQTQQWEDGDTLFIRCAAWNDLAQHIASSLSKGMKVIAMGELTQRTYQTQQGENRTVIELKVNDIGPSLRNATATVAKAARANGAQSTAGYAQSQQPAPNQPAQQGFNDPWSTQEF